MRAFILGATPPRSDKHDNGQNARIVALNNLSVWIGETKWSISQPFLHHCERAWKWSPPPLKDFDFWLVLKGQGRMNLAGNEYALEAGRWFLLQPGDLPRAAHEPKNPLIVFACHFQSHRPARYQNEVLGGVCHESLRRDAEVAVQAYREGRSGQELAGAMLRQMILRVIHSLTREHHSSGRERLDSLAMEISSAPGRNWSMAEMARLSAISPPHLNRLWRKAWGMPPRQYVIRQRVLRAITLLRESDLPIQQIAATLGYNDIFFFHRQFRRVAGATPRSIRLGAGVPSFLE